MLILPFCVPPPLKRNAGRPVISATSRRLAELLSGSFRRRCAYRVRRIAEGEGRGEEEELAREKLSRYSASNIIYMINRALYMQIKAQLEAAGYSYVNLTSRRHNEGN